MLFLPRSKKIEYTHNGSSNVTVQLEYRLTYEQYQLADGDFYLHIRNKANDCDMVCPTCGGAL